MKSHVCVDMRMKMLRENMPADKTPHKCQWMKRATPEKNVIGQNANGKMPRDKMSRKHDRKA